MGFQVLILTQMRQVGASFASFLLHFRPEFNSAKSHFAPILLLASIQGLVIVVFLAKTAELMLNLGQLFGLIPSIDRLSPLVSLTKEARCRLHLT